MDTLADEKASINCPLCSSVLNEMLRCHCGFVMRRRRLVPESLANGYDRYPEEEDDE
jgi:hypothetical protein